MNRNEAHLSHNVIYDVKSVSTSFVAIECQDNCREASIHDNKLVNFEPGGLGIVHSGEYLQVNHTT